MFNAHQTLMVLIYLVSIFSYFFSISVQQHKVQCTDDVMKVLVGIPESDTRVYLEGLNGYKNEKCEPKIEDNLAVFELSLINFYDCGIIRVVNKLTVSAEARLIFYGSRLISYRLVFFPGQENILPQDHRRERKRETNRERKVHHAADQFERHPVSDAFDRPQGCFAGRFHGT